MKNEIGRKLTSLTIMAIMFAGLGIVQGIPAFMPGASADFSETDGMLSVSSVYIQGGAILEVVVNDPAVSDTSSSIANGPSVDIDGTTYATNQASNGKWYVYAVDKSVSTLLDADGDGMEYGIQCTTGLGINTGNIETQSVNTGSVGVANIIGDTSYNIWAEAISTSGTSSKQAGGCLDINNSIGTLDDVAGTTSRQLMSAAVLQGAPSLSNYNGATGNDTNVDLGQRGHSLNGSGYGSWPYILAFEFSSTMSVDYGTDSIDVEFGNTSGETAISIANNSPADETHISLSITDPALNIDPTSVDKWRFNVAADNTGADNGGGGHQLAYAGNATDTNDDANNFLSLPQLGDAGFTDNGRLNNSTGSALATVDGLRDVIMTESGVNTGVFDSWASNGTSQIVTVDEAVGDKKVVFTYGGNSADLIITYNTGDISMDAGAGDWVTGTTAYVTVTDPDMNKYPHVAETLSIGDEDAIIPTIVMGTPLTLANSDGNNNLEDGDSANSAGVRIGMGSQDDGDASPEKTEGLYVYTIHNTTDNSERMRIIHTAFTVPSTGHNIGGSEWGNAGTTADESVLTWINVTTAHDINSLIALEGTSVLNYDISGPAGDLASTAISVFVVGTGTNTTGAADIGAVTSGNARSGVVDLDDGTDQILNNDVQTRSESVALADSTFVGNQGAVNVGVHFKITHPAGTYLNTTADYAIAADFCNFDQNNGSSVHNCIYRIEAVETGEDTGVFEGEVSYVMLNNSTARAADNGEHSGNDEEVEDLMGTNSDAVTVVLMNTADSVRVVYNDTDALQASGKIGAQLDGVTHTGEASLDATTYGADDMATITIVDKDLDQDSSVRDTYENSSRTFQMNVTGSSGASSMPFATKPMTIIETTSDSGIFVGTFKVPDFKGQDMSLTYYDSLDASGSATEQYAEATVVSNSGSVAFDRSVYPVPFFGSGGAATTSAGDLRTGAGGTTGQAEAGNVTMTITVEDADFGGDVMNVTNANTAGTILVKLIEGSTTTTCFTAGSETSRTQHTSTSTIQELGPLSATEVGSGVFELEFTVDEVQHCGTMRTITSGDVFQVEYVDTADDAGTSTTVYDSSTFDLRTGSLSVDKDVYVLGSDVVITLTDPDLNLNSGSTESYALSMIEWDSDADSSELLDDTDNFSASPSSLQETGDDTGVFQSVVTIPQASLYPGGVTSATKVIIDYGEEVTLTYVDVGLSGEDTTEADVLDVEAYFSISNFGALVELDKAVYNWTDTVYFTITSPDHNTNSASEEQIGSTSLPIQVSTRSGKLCSSEKTYKADESGPDTGVFTGEVGLVGFTHTMSASQAYVPATTSCGSTATGGVLQTSAQTDGVSVSYEYNDGSVIVASASVVWNIGESSFDSSVASAGGSSVFTVVDPDENLDSTITDAFTVAVYSDSDAGGFTLTMNETDEDTGVFEGTVFFTSDAATSGSNIRVSEGDTVTAEYTDETLPEPYTTADDLTIAGTLTIGTAFPPLERAPAANARVVDAFGSSVAEVSSGQQVQIAADVSNGQSKEQAFAYLVQVQDGNGVTVSLAWITGSLTAGQSMSPALSWTPDASGTYTATVFVWESVDNPTALSPTVSVDIDVV